MKPIVSCIPLATATTLAAGAAAAAFTSLDDLIAKIKDKDDKVRGPAWQSAGPAGAAAVGPLANAMTEPDLEVARAAKRALWQVVRYAGRPGAEKEKLAVAAELLNLLKIRTPAVGREALWMLSEIGGDNAVQPIAALLADQALREDARAALERIPGAESLRALQSALGTVSEEFKPAIAQSLRVRGVALTGYPSQKLVPTRPAPGGAPKTI